MKIAVALLALLVFAAPAVAKPVTETASLGTVRAELSYVTHGKDEPATDVVMRVFDGDAQIVQKAISDKTGLVPITPYAAESAVHVQDLDGDGVGEARFDLYSGGAHCCEITYFYKGAQEIRHDFADPGYRVITSPVAGVPYLVSADPAFAYAFSSFASSLFPVQVFQLEDGALVDVTRAASLKPRVSREATKYKHFYRRVKNRPKDLIAVERVRSSLAAYTADECTLGECETGYELVRTAAGRGYVRPAFLKQLKRFLARRGYDAAG